MNHHKLRITFFIAILFLAITIFVPKTTARQEDNKFAVTAIDQTWCDDAQGNCPYSTTAGTPVRYAGSFSNSTNGYGGSVILDIDVEPTKVSGNINFTDGPDVPGVLCGAGSFNGSRTGNTFSFNFVSNDPEPGCEPYNGINMSVSGTISGNEIVNGTYSVPSLGQGGTFSAKQTIRSNGRFYNSSLTADGNVYTDLATWGNSIAGYIDFTGDAGETGLCGANSFTGTRSGNALSFSFLSSDSGAGCTNVDDKRFNLTANLSANSLTNGTYYVPYFAQGGTFYTNGPAADSTAPNGSVTAPSANANIGPGNHTLTANATDNSGGTGVSYVNFKVKYNGSWHFISTDPTPPYTAQWQSPSNLHSQQIRFAVDIVDKTGNNKTEAGGTVLINFIESLGGNVNENWVTKDLSRYLNQLSLSPDGNLKCGGSSAAMVLAINNKIPANYTNIASTANTFGHTSHIYFSIKSGLDKRGMATSIHSCITANDAWNIIKTEIDAGRPLIVLNTRVTDGHYFTVIGYREKNNNREIIVYDPFGKWIGVRNRYDANSTSPTSYKGYWRVYDFDDSWGYDIPPYGSCSANRGHLVSTHSTGLQTPAFTNETTIPTIPPGEISDEPENIVTYEGIGDVVTVNVYLPTILSP
ncbi:MAG: C39 family peptidase [Anaerolineae bacterium]|nr:C39 family peptidase [Anaerolineae bacterium]